MKVAKNKKKIISVCDKFLTQKNTKLQLACKKVEVKLNDKAFRRKLLIASVIFLLFNLVIILILAKKTIAYKLTKYFAKKILEGADPKEKEIIAQIQTNLPVVVEFVNKHADTIKQANNNYIYYSNMYKDFVKAVSDPGPETVLPGSFPEKDTLPELPSRKLDETEAKQLIDDLVGERPPYFLMNLY